MPKGIACRIIDNPRKYQELIQFMKHKTSNTEELSAEKLRELHQHLFREPTTTSEVVQLQSFINVHRDEVNSHLSLNHEFILLDQQQRKIIDKLKLMKTIESQTFGEKSFKRSLLEDICRKAWQKDPKKKISQW
ncbi:hypothetical protein TKK_0013761 [Trichogramma kaykai]